MYKNTVHYLMMSPFLSLAVSSYSILLLLPSPEIHLGLVGSLKAALRKCDGIFRA
jgi:hypothetical protein